MRIAINRKDGGVSIMQLAQGAKVDEEIVKWRSSYGADAYVSHAELKEVPTDRTFRDAWTHAGGKVEVDMPKARDIYRDRLRALRAPQLAALDIEYQRADEKGDAEEKQRIAKAKQVLRDVTQHPDIEAAKTPDELKALFAT